MSLRTNGSCSDLVSAGAGSVPDSLLVASFDSVDAVVDANLILRSVEGAMVVGRTNWFVDLGRDRTMLKADLLILAICEI